MHRVITDFAPKELHENINKIMSSPQFAWFYLPYVAEEWSRLGQEGRSWMREQAADDFYFTHTFYSSKTKSVNSDSFDDIIVPLCSILLGKDMPLIRAKANLFTKRDKQMKYGFHTDYKFDKHTTLVYSVNTNNGYTEFKDGTIIPSIANQLLIFDGNMHHRSVGQTDIRNRMNLNINLKLDPALLINPRKNRIYA